MTLGVLFLVLRDWFAVVEEGLDAGTEKMRISFADDGREDGARESTEDAEVDFGDAWGDEDTSAGVFEVGFVVVFGLGVFETTTTDVACSVVETRWGITSWVLVDMYMEMVMAVLLGAPPPSGLQSPKHEICIVSGVGLGWNDSATIAETGRVLNPDEKGIVFGSNPNVRVRGGDRAPQLFLLLDSCARRSK